MGVGREGWTQSTDESDSPEAEGRTLLSLSKKRKHRCGGQYLSV